ncbi:MAG: type II secretion system F family protein, partial [Eggerthellaceae bacterium]|nr:type II secretion system F family protein [Eggerthellaceae bacterium]
RFQEVCGTLYERLVAGSSFADAMRATEGFPAYATSMVEIGESSGHLEAVLRNLEEYYDEEARMFSKLRSSVGRPAALLVIMAVILAFTLFVILPVFSGTYETMTGSLASGSAASVVASYVIGAIALVITVVLAILALWVMRASSSEGGRQKVLRLFERFPVTRKAMYQLSLSRFTAALATHVSSGITNEAAMERAVETVENERLHAVLTKASASMTDLDNPRSLTQAISEYNVFEPLYQRLLEVGMRSGSTEETLASLSSTFFDDAIAQVDRSLNHIEPIFAAFLTVAVGIALIAVMLPLIGIMGSIG